MSIYIFNICSIPLWIGLVNIIKMKKNKENVYIGIICIQMALIIGMRGIEVGVDTNSYNSIYISSSYVRWNEIFNYYLEPGYMFINKFISAFGGEYRAVLLFNAFVTMFGVYFFIKKCSWNRLLSIFIFVGIGYFNSTMNIMRQYLAVAIILIAYANLVNNKKSKNYIFLVLVASCIHKSSIILLPFLFIYKALYSERVKNTIILKFVVWFSLILLVLGIGKIAAYIPWFNYDYMTNGAAYEYSIINMGFAIKVVMLIICLYILKNQNNYEKEKIDNIIFLNYLNIISCILNIGSVTFNMFTRLNIYFSITLIALIPNIIELLPIKNKKIVSGLVSLFFVIIYLVQLPTDGNKIIPYTTIL